MTWMLAAILLGAGGGPLLVWLVRELVPRRTTAVDSLVLFEARGQARSGPVWARPQDWGAVLAGWVQRAGISYTQVRADLVLTGRDFESLLVRKVAAFLAGFLLVLAGCQGLRAAGVGLPLASPLLLAVACGAGLFVVPDLEVRTEARNRREEFRQVLSSYLVLVSLGMSGAAAPAEALPRAAEAGDAWPLVVLRETLLRAATSGQDLWDALIGLGQRIGVRDLVELGQACQSVGVEGARIRDTLAGQAESMRRGELADAEGQAGQRETSMRVALLVIALGFILGLLYPAVMNVLTL